MRLVIESGKLFKDAMDLISNIVNEVTFEMTKDGVKLVAMDPGNISMVILNMLPSAFKEFSVDEDKISLSLNDLTSILKRVKPDDIVSLEKQENKLLVMFEGKTKRKFFLPLLDVAEESRKVPDLSFSATIELPSNILEEAIADAKVVSDAVVMKVKDKQFIVEAEDNLNKVEEVIPEAKVTVSEDEVKSKYSIDYLDKMITKKLSDLVLLKFGNTYPIKIEYNLVDIMQLAFILAPRMDTE